MHKPILIKQLGLSFKQKLCFEDFSTTIYSGQRIGIIGNNGAGKSTLLKIILQQVEPTEGSIHLPEALSIGYVPQVLDEDQLSGAQRFQKRFTQELLKEPDILLLDEPTNNLDIKNRKSLMNMLKRFDGTLIIVTHDIELLRTCIDQIWFIEQEEINVFDGNYGDLQKQQLIEKEQVEHKTIQIKKQRRKNIKALEHEKERLAHSKRILKKSGNYDYKLLSEKKKQADKTEARQQKQINKFQDRLKTETEHHFVRKQLKPRFSITISPVKSGPVMSVRDGSIGYGQTIIISGVNITVGSTDRISLAGVNGSGKSTFLKALLDQENITKEGEWRICNNRGYLDQHYKTLNPDDTVFDTIKRIMPDQNDAQIRQFLNDFLFRKNEEVNATVSTLSGGERVRLCLAQIVARSPILLLLDEVTNNLDLETREYVIQVLNEYPGAIVVISHDSDFLERIGITHRYEVKNNKLLQR